MDKELADALDEGLEALIKGAGLEEVLARYLERARELEPLLRAALALRQASAVAPDPNFKAAARYHFRRALFRPKARRPLWAWSWRWAPVLGVLLLFLLGGGTVVASSQSLPDQSLYPVKLAREEVQLFLAPSAEERARLNLHFAEQRLEELQAQAARGQHQGVERAAARLARHWRTALNEETREKEGEKAFRIRGLLRQEGRRQGALMQELGGKLPPRARPFLEDAAGEAGKARLLPFGPGRRPLPLP